MKKYIAFVIVIATLCLFNTTHATVWYIHPDSTLNSIQTGIDSCSTGDTVLVGPGTYTENINFNSMAITVTSEQGPDTTIIDGEIPSHPDTGSVVLFISGEDTTSILEGFTITHGSGTIVPPYGTVGGGIYCFNQSSPTITNNIIVGNSATWGGGGIECMNSSSAIITNNTITENTCPYGGGLDCSDYSSPTITGNTITDNTADTTNEHPQGAGIYCYNNSSPTIAGNTISLNKSFWVGGGIVCAPDCNPLISGNIITGNTADSLGGGIVCYQSSPTITDNIITGNTCETVGGGIACRTSSPNIEYCTIANNNGDGVYCDSMSDPDINYNNIVDNIGYGVLNIDPGVLVNAENNWWGDATGPYHPSVNPGGLGDTVSDYVDFDPWLAGPGVGEQPVIKRVERYYYQGATIFSGPLQLPEGKKCKVFDITGRVVASDKIQPGIYFIEVDGVVTQKVVKVR